jgi:hypothetical protein
MKEIIEVHKKDGPASTIPIQFSCLKKCVNTIRRETYDKRQNLRSHSCLAYRKYILLTKNLLTALKALRQMFKSNEDPPLALEAESSN